MQQEHAEQDDLLRTKFGAFVASLHEAGIYFRSLHLNNVILTPDNRFGLIDVADMRVLGRPVTPSLARRNFRHMLRDKRDRAWLLADQGIAFYTAYCQARWNSPPTLQKMLEKREFMLGI